MRIPNNIPRFLWHFIRMQPWAFALLFTTATIWSINETFFPYFLKLIVNAIHNYKDDPHQVFQVLILPLSCLLGFWLTMEIAMRLEGIAILKTFPRFRANIRMAVFNYTKHHSYDYFNNNFAGSIAKKLAELPTSGQTVMEILCFNITSILVAFTIALILMWQAKPFFAWVLLTWFVAHFIVTLLFLRIGNKRWEEHAAAATILSGKIVDSLTNIANVQLFAREPYEYDYLEPYQKDEVKKASAAMWTLEKMRIIQGLFAFLMIFSMIYLLIHGWIQGWVTLGDFTLVGMLAFWILGLIWYMSYQLTVFVREIGTIHEGLTLISQSHEIIDKPNASRLIVNAGKIEFENVSFAYQNNYIFKGLNVTIPAKQKIGLVGFSGAGKSTFANLILRLYDIEAGKIMIDDRNIADVTQQSLRKNIAMIPQNPALFHRSLMENIRYGRTDATDAEVIAAAKLAHCHEFISQLPETYHALVGERGVKLSGGQRQRIAIARAILKNAPILILDEATSSLDTVTEQLIQESLQHLMQTATVIVIAHRLSTLADMDRIIVFDKGVIVEEGTQPQLLAQGGHFADLWQRQSGGFLPEQN